ncbi:anoctamin-7 isoform X5 [Canis lupus familiaris]|uniref:anoctamin-7 isoform X5 n=1 Tax=Canis lupus familiaris TaxID=9615 RepID=UPI0018F7DB88|nr:anoctamin-7 isoform X5 [Canis lupus familiaris]
MGTRTGAQPTPQRLRPRLGGRPEAGPAAGQRAPGQGGHARGLEGHLPGEPPRSRATRGPAPRPQLLERRALRPAQRALGRALLPRGGPAPQAAPAGAAQPGLPLVSEAAGEAGHPQRPAGGRARRAARVLHLRVQGQQAVQVPRERQPRHLLQQHRQAPDPVRHPGQDPVWPREERRDRDRPAAGGRGLQRRLPPARLLGSLAQVEQVPAPGARARVLRGEGGPVLRLARLLHGLAPAGGRRGHAGVPGGLLHGVLGHTHVSVPSAPGLGPESPEVAVRVGGPLASCAELGTHVSTGDMPAPLQTRPEGDGWAGLLGSSCGHAPLLLVVVRVSQKQTALGSLQEVNSQITINIIIIIILLYIFKYFIYLFMRDTERQRRGQREKQLPAGSPTRDSIPGPGVTPGGEGRRSPAEPPGAPVVYVLILLVKEMLSLAKAVVGGRGRGRGQTDAPRPRPPQAALRPEGRSCAGARRTCRCARGAPTAPSGRCPAPAPWPRPAASSTTAAPCSSARSWRSGPRCCWRTGGARAPRWRTAGAAPTTRTSRRGLGLSSPPRRPRRPRTRSRVAVVVMCLVSVILCRGILAALVSRSSSAPVASWASRIASFTGSLVNLVFILVLSKIYVALARVLTRWEMHRTQTKFEDAFTLKVFIFQFVNFYSSPIYVAFFKGRFVGYPGNYHTLFGVRNEECAAGGCLVELAQELLVIMVGKQVVNNVQEVLVPQLQAWWHTARLRRGRRRPGPAADRAPWEADYELLPCGDLFQEYLETVLQFGFVTIFVAACPLAPLFALLNNWVEVRLDARKLVCQQRRPVAQRAQDIGIWAHILAVIAHLAVVSNAFLLAFTSDFLPRTYYRWTHAHDLRGFLNFTLAHAPPAFAAAHNRTCRYQAFREDDGQYSPTYWNLLAIRLAFVIVFEHVVFSIGRLLDLLVPDIPESVEVKVKREYYLAKQALAENGALSGADGAKDGYFPGSESSLGPQPPAPGVGPAPPAPSL